MKTAVEIGRSHGDAGQSSRQRPPAGHGARSLAPPVYDIGSADGGAVALPAVGLPAALRSGIQLLSGMDMSDVRVHRNSAAPAQLGALGFARGSDIHLAPGQERHLAHEAWHVVQQRKGVVGAPLQMKAVQVDHDTPLEREADAMGALAERQGAAAQVHASRPADPGTGDGVDLTFILKPGSGDMPAWKAYIEDARSFIKNVLQATDVQEVSELQDLFAALLVADADGVKVRRIRIVGHGSHNASKRTGGKVLMHDQNTGAGTWWTPADVARFAADPANQDFRDAIKNMMLPGAVVEFWGCNLGKYQEAQAAWAGLFQSTFIATPHKVVHEFAAYQIPAADGSLRAARNCAQVDQAGPLYTKKFNRFLLALYVDLVRWGEMAPAQGDGGDAAISLMRKLFNDSSGHITYLSVHAKDGKGRTRTIMPGDTADWNAAWVAFAPVPLAALADVGATVPAQQEPAAPPQTPQTVTVETARVAEPAPTVADAEADAAPATTPAVADQGAASMPDTPRTAPVANTDSPESAGPAALAQPQPQDLVADERAMPSAESDGAMADRVGVAAKAEVADVVVPGSPVAATAALRPAVSRRNSTIALERRWEAEHPQGMSTSDGPSHLVLWNFGVNGSALKPGHLAALHAFARHAEIAFLFPQLEIQIDGHTSRSGARRQNVDLGIERANAAFNDLVEHGIAGDRCRLDWHDSAEPWSDAMNGEALARNRRVELRLIGPSRPVPAASPRQQPEPPKMRRQEPAAALKIGEQVPGASVEFKKEFVPERPLRLGRYVLCHATGEISGKYKLASERDASLAIQFKDGSDAKIQFKTKLDEMTDFKLDSAGNFGIGLKGDFLNLKHELIVDWKSLAKAAPVVYGVSWAGSSPSLEYPEGSGLHWSVEFEVKGKFAFGPSPEALAELGLRAAGGSGATATAAATTEGVATGAAALGAAEAVAAGGIGLGLALFAFTLHQAAHAGPEGEMRARLFARHVGFARRLAADGASAYGTRLAIGGLLPGDQYQDYYDGWQDAERMLAVSSPAAVESLRRFSQPYGESGVDRCTQALLQRAGAYAFRPLPESLEALNLP